MNQTPTNSFRLRPPTDADAEAFAMLQNASMAERGIEGARTADDVRRMWASPGNDPQTKYRLAELSDGRVAGHVGVEHLKGSDQAHAGGFVLPELRGRGIGSALLQWAIDQARTFDGVTEFRTGGPAERADAIDMIEGWGGFEHIRSWFRMVNRDPANVAEPHFPPGIEIRTLEGDELIDTWCAAYDGSFIDHFNFHPFDRDEVEHWVRTEPGFDPTLIHFAFDGDVLAGYCNTELIKGGSVLRGDLGPIGTLRSHRGIGLGRALLRLGTRELAARGCAEVVLGVDSENPNGAVALYEKNGYEQTHEGRSYRLKL